MTESARKRNKIRLNPDEIKERIKAGIRHRAQWLAANPGKRYVSCAANQYKDVKMGNAYKTSGGLTEKDILRVVSKSGKVRYVSKARHQQGKEAFDKNGLVPGFDSTPKKGKHIRFSP